MRLRLYTEDGVAVIDLAPSHRNLLSLLHKLDMPGSARTLESSGDVPAGALLRVRSEDDAEHYARRGWPAGPMHPATEAFIAQRQRDADDV